MDKLQISHKLDSQVGTNSGLHNQAEQKGNAIKKNQAVNLGIKAANAQEPNSLINKYLIMVARLENGINTGSLNGAEIKDLVSNISTKVENLGEREQAFLNQSEKFKELGLNTKNFRKNLSQLLNTGETRDSALALLKSKEFLGSIKDEPRVAMVYSRSKLIPASEESVTNKYRYHSYNPNVDSYNRLNKKAS